MLENINRRTFFGLLLAPFIARFLPSLAPSAVPPLSTPPTIQNPGLFGLKYYDVPNNSGSFMGIRRSAYPDSFIGNTSAFRDTLKQQATAAWHIDHFRIPGSFRKYMEAESRIAHA